MFWNWAEIRYLNCQTPGWQNKQFDGSVINDYEKSKCNSQYDGWMVKIKQYIGFLNAKVMMASNGKE